MGFGAREGKGGKERMIEIFPQDDHGFFDCGWAVFGNRAMDLYYYWLLPRAKAERIEKYAELHRV